MKLTELIRARIVIGYCVFCIFFFLYKFFTNGLLSQIVPSFYYNKLDFTTLLIQTTGAHRYFLNNFILCLLADSFYFLLPFFYLWVYYKRNRLMPLAGGLIFTCNLIYSIIYCSFPTDSLEGHIALIIFPLVFIPLTLKGFWFIFQAVRYYFLFFLFISWRLEDSTRWYF